LPLRHSWRVASFAGNRKVDGVAGSERLGFYSSSE